MSFTIRKKIISAVFLSLIFVLLFSVSASAYAEDGGMTPQASDYISSTELGFRNREYGGMLVETKLVATRIIDKLGIISLEIQAKVNGYWRTVDTIVSDNYRYNSVSYVYDTIYYGTEGTEYRAYVKFYAENQGGSDTRIIISSPLIAE